jgi:hypothetical protein
LKRRKKLALLLLLLLALAVGGVAWFEHQDKRHYEPSESVFFAINLSGSMGWDMGQYTATDGSKKTGCRLDRAKNEAQRRILALPPDAQFDVLAFDCALTTWQPHLVTATRANKTMATQWIDTLQPQGAEGDGPAVSQALSDPETRHVVLFTDCKPNCGAGNQTGDLSCFEAHRQMIRQANTRHAVVDVVNIGGQGVMRETFVKIAAENGGTFLDLP